MTKFAHPPPQIIRVKNDGKKYIYLSLRSLQGFGRHMINKYIARLGEHILKDWIGYCVILSVQEDWTHFIL